MLAKFFKSVKTYQSDIILAITIVLISITAFNLGKISAYQQKKTPITITKPESANGLVTRDNGNSQNPERLGVGSRKLGVTQVFASKVSKSKVYHFPWCPGASKIADKNKLTFATETAAISAGYTLAGNCSR